MNVVARCIDRGERGSGTVLALTLVMMAGFLAAVVAMLGEVIVARHRVQAAADLSALAAAAGWPTADCRDAAKVARGNRTTLTECSQSADGSVTVTVRSETVRLPLMEVRMEVVARARAGVGGTRVGFG